jgi:hypothetical protein
MYIVTNTNGLRHFPKCNTEALHSLAPHTPTEHALSHPQYIEHDEELSEQTVRSHDARHLIATERYYLRFYNLHVLHFTFYYQPLNTSFYT